MTSLTRFCTSMTDNCVLLWISNTSSVSKSTTCNPALSNACNTRLDGVARFDTRIISDICPVHTFVSLILRQRHFLSMSIDWRRLHAFSCELLNWEKSLVALTTGGLSVFGAESVRRYG